jgi:hypothetical protein
MKRAKNYPGGKQVIRPEDWRDISLLHPTWHSEQYNSPIRPDTKSFKFQIERETLCKTCCMMLVTIVFLASSSNLSIAT